MCCFSCATYNTTCNDFFDDLKCRELAKSILNKWQQQQQQQQSQQQTAMLPPRNRQPPKHFAPPPPGQQYQSDILDESPLLRQQDLWRRQEAVANAEDEEIVRNLNDDVPVVEAEDGRSIVEGEAEDGVDEQEEEEDASELFLEETETEAHPFHNQGISFDQGVDDADDDIEIGGGQLDWHKFSLISQARESLRIRPVVSLLLLLVAPAALLSIVLVTSGMSLMISHATTSSKMSIASHLPPCFEPYPLAQDNDDSAPDGSCADPDEREPCPPGGVCSNGRLESCNESFRLVSPSRDECILSDTSRMALEEIKQLLEQKTSEYYCSIPAQLRYQNVDVESAPCFDIALFDGGSQEVRDLLASPFTVDIIYNDGQNCIGFGDSKEALSVVRFKCRFELGVILFMERYEDIALKTPKYLWDGLWFTVKYYPVESMAVVIVCVIGARIIKLGGRA